MSGMAKATVAAILLSVAVALQSATAQVPGPQAVPAPGAVARMSPADIEALVAPVALYPDDLLAVLLRATAAPVQIVQAARFLDKTAQDKTLQPSPHWIEPVRVLLNYPEVLRRLNDGLDWTQTVGALMQTQQADVLAAVQQFRRKVAAAGNLRSDDKLTVQLDGGAYVIESVNPKIIYVPVYDPAQVLVPRPQPVQTVYVPTPYPAYYEPYPAGAAAAGFYFGALTTAWAFNWRNYDIDEDDIREFQQSRQQSLADRQKSRQDTTAQRQQTRQDSAGQRQQDRQDNRPNRPPGGQGDLRAALGGSSVQGQPPRFGGDSGQRPGIQQNRPPNPGGTINDRPGYQQQRPAGQGVQQRPAQSADAFSYGSGRDAFQASDRGAQSRNFGGGGGGGRQFQGGGGRGGRR